MRGLRVGVVDEVVAGVVRGVAVLGLMIGGTERGEYVIFLELISSCVASVGAVLLGLLDAHWDS